MMVNHQLIHGEALEWLPRLPDRSARLIFADPPYNLSGTGFLTCKGGKPVPCNKGEWDQIEDLHEFNRLWIRECARMPKHVSRTPNLPSRILRAPERTAKQFPVAVNL